MILFYETGYSMMCFGKRAGEVGESSVIIDNDLFPGSLLSYLSSGYPSLADIYLEPAGRIDAGQQKEAEFYDECFRGDIGLSCNYGSRLPRWPFRGLLGVPSRCSPRVPLTPLKGRFPTRSRPFVAS